MTTPRRDDDTSARDLRVATAWRATSTEQPPSALDAAILAAARREVGAGPQAGAWRSAAHARRRWWPLAVAATVGAIAAGLLQLAPPAEVGAPAADIAIVTDVPKGGMPVTEQSEKAAPAEPLPLPPTRPPVQIAGVPAKSALLDPLPAAPRRLETSGPPAPPMSPAAPPINVTKREPAASADAQPASASPPAPPSAAAVARAPERLAAESPPAAAPLAKFAAAPPVAGSAAEARAKERPPLPVAEWIALIRRLRANGETDDAVLELAAFRTAHPDHERLLPADLRDWRPPPR